jgi:hypothetical protein
MNRVKSTLVAGAAGLLIVAGAAFAHSSVGAAQNSTPTAGMSQEQEDANATPVVGTPIFQPAIDLTAAQQAALAGQSGAVVTAVELNGDDGALIWDVTLSTGVDVSVDATTGAVLGTEQADDNGDHGKNDGENSDDNNQGKGDGETADDNNQSNNDGETADDDSGNGGNDQGDANENDKGGDNQNGDNGDQENEND